MNHNPPFSNQLVAWAYGAAIAAIAFIILLAVGGFSIFPAAFLAAIVFLGVGSLIVVLFCSPLPKPGDVPPPGPKTSTKPAPGVTSAHASPASKTAPSAASAAPVAEAETVAPQVKASTLLPGEAELADRKGSWTYGGATPAASDGPVVAADGPGMQPEALTQARDGGPDNLKEIKGVGPALEKLCHALGIYHFDQVAGWGPDEVAWMDQNLKGFKGRVTRDNWVEQAKILAAGGDTEFSKRVDEGDVY